MIRACEVGRIDFGRGVDFAAGKMRGLWDSLRAYPPFSAEESAAGAERTLTKPAPTVFGCSNNGCYEGKTFPKVERIVEPSVSL